MRGSSIAPVTSSKECLVEGRPKVQQLQLTSPGVWVLQEVWGMDGLGTTNRKFFKQNTVLFIEQHIYKHSGDVWKYFIFATPKNCKVKSVSVRFDATFEMLLQAR